MCRSEIGVGLVVLENSVSAAQVVGNINDLDRHTDGALSAAVIKSVPELSGAYAHISMSSTPYPRETRMQLPTSPLPFLPLVAPSY